MDDSDSSRPVSRGIGPSRRAFLRCCGAGPAGRTQSAPEGTKLRSYIMTLSHNIKIIEWNYTPGAPPPRTPGSLRKGRFALVSAVALLYGRRRRSGLVSTACAPPRAELRPGPVFRTVVSLNRTYYNYDV
jgi:hypothetical protein